MQVYQSEVSTPVTRKEVRGTVPHRSHTPEPSFTPFFNPSRYPLYSYKKFLSTSFFAICHNEDLSTLIFTLIFTLMYLHFFPVTANLEFEIHDSLLYFFIFYFLSMYCFDLLCLFCSVLLLVARSKMNEKEMNKKR